MSRIGKLFGRRPLSLGLLLLVALAGCDFENEGAPPGGNLIYFPTGMALWRADSGRGAPEYLLVVNSNFDRRYNAGSVQSVDLDALDVAADDCGTDPASGRKCIIDPAAVITDEVLIGSLGRGAAMSRDHRFLYVPSAVETGLTFIRVNADGEFECGQGGGRRCSGGNVAGDDSSTNQRNVRVPSDPVGVVAGRFFDYRELDFNGQDESPREYIVVAYRAGQAALFVHERTDGGRVALADATGGLNSFVTGVAYDEATGFVYATSQRSVGGKKYLQRIGIIGNETDALTSGLFAGDLLYLNGVAPGPNTWSATFVPRPAGDDGLARTTGFIVSQAPNALLRVEMDAETDAEVSVETIASVGTGAARLAHAVLEPPGGGEPLELVVVSSFVERQSRVFIIEAATGRAIAIIPGFSGSFELAVDEVRQRIYVADFSASVVRVVDLAPLWDGEQPYIQATLGRPQVVEELQ